MADEETTDQTPTARQDWCGYQKRWYLANREKILAKKRHRYAVERAKRTERYIRMRQTSHEWIVVDRRARLKVLNATA